MFKKIIADYIPDVNKICSLFGILRRVEWQFVTDVSGPISSPETAVRN